jgi:transcriptional regulator with XRE-family HTH domain
MKSHTQADVEFMRRVAERLEEIIENGKKEKPKLTVQKLASELGVTLQGLQKHRQKKSIPTLDFLDRLQRRIRRDRLKELKYGTIRLDDEFFEHRVTKAKDAPAIQMTLPFAIQSLTEKNIHLELGEGPRKPNEIELKVKIEFAS